MNAHHQPGGFSDGMIYRELVADHAPHRAGLSERQMVGVSRTPAN
jgi:hypothetical protein